jgi:predicted nuclease of predicted toxin-antitoxin system
VKILLDACLSTKARDELALLGHDVVFAGDREEDPGDEVILATAYREGRVLITLDKDFGDLGVLRGMPHHGIIRLVDFRSTDQGRISVKVLASYAEDLQAGAIITVQPGRARIRRP